MDTWSAAVAPGHLHASNKRMKMCNGMKFCRKEPKAGWDSNGRSKAVMDVGEYREVEDRNGCGEKKHRKRVRPRTSKTSCFKCIVHNEAPTRLQKPRGQTKRWHNENINCENIMFHIENIVPQMHCSLCLHIYFCHHFQKESAGNVRAPEVHLLLDLKQ